ncbi:phosphotransferase [Streptomyces daliensis]|uniref:Phosphotransferase n=1 Tax=Streptomyces daliensis TaxID=299421 RepID=A0A8T4IIQ3_9ACTN|nr:phosphotransferase [Streptomyces daliensis]
MAAQSEASGARGASGAFTEARAREVLALAGEDPGRARLLAHGENAVFVLPGSGGDAEGDPAVASATDSGGDGDGDGAWTGGTVVRVGRAQPDLVARAAHELRVASWLEECGVPAVRAARAEAVVIEGHPLTFWRRLPEPVRTPGPGDLAALLRRVHALPAPPFALPPRDLLGGIERWLRIAGDAIPAADAAYLRARRDDFAAAAAELIPVLPPGPIHGDALPRNIQVGPDGPVLLDLETFSHDLREHDLVVMALSHDRYGLGDEGYADFTGTYGYDVRDWPGCAVLRGARETASCAWVAQHAPVNPAAGREFARRVASLREGDTTVRWLPF